MDMKFLERFFPKCFSGLKNKQMQIYELNQPLNTEHDNNI